MLRPTPPRPVLGAALALLLAAVPAARADRGGIRLSFAPMVVNATEDSQWRIPIKVINDLDAGVFGDSMRCDIEDLDPGLTRAGRLSTATSNAVAAVMKSLGRRDSSVITYTGGAVAERARLTFHLYVRTAEGEVHEGVGSCEVGPSMIARSFQSSFIMNGAKRVETVTIPERWPRGSSPAVLLIHPEGSHARRLVPIAWTLANAGYTVMLVSLPGYGQTDGEPDFGGPASMRALSLALDSLRHSTPVDADRIAVWGISRGATAAALLAAQRPDNIAALVLQSGVYDPQSANKDTKSDSLRRALKTEAKKDGGWDKRSALRAANQLKMPVLFIHGDLDTEAVSNQAVNLAGKLRAAGGEVRLELVPGVGHAVPTKLSLPMVKDFLEPRLHPKK